MSDKATLRRLLRELSEAKRTEEVSIKEEAIIRLFDAVRNDDKTSLEAELIAIRTERDGAREVALKFGEELNTLKELAKDAHVPLKELDSALKGIMIERQRCARLVDEILPSDIHEDVPVWQIEQLRRAIESGEQPQDTQ